MRFTSAIAVSGLLVTALAGCGSSAKSTASAVPGAGAPAPVASGGGTGAAGGLGVKAELLATAAVMQKLGSAKVTVSSAEAGGDNGTGVYAWGDKPALDLTSSNSGKPMRIRVVDGVAYLGVGDAQAAELGGKHWAKLDSSGPAAGPGSSLQALSLLLDPALQLAAAAQSGKLSAVGAQSLNGTATQHYRSVMPADSLVAGIPNLKDDQRAALLDALKQDGSTVTSDFWVDAKHQLVQQQEAGSDGASAGASASASPDGSGTTITTYSDLGTKVSVSAPAASDQASAADALKLLALIG
ncbi:hypothetical protein [Kitasatospora nipponensis]